VRKVREPIKIQPDKSFAIFSAGAYLRRDAKSAVNRAARILSQTRARIGPLAEYLLAVSQLIQPERNQLGCHRQPGCCSQIFPAWLILALGFYLKVTLIYWGIRL
jgi:hypothetical protein